MRKTYLLLPAILLALCTFTVKAQDFESKMEEKLEFINKQLNLETAQRGEFAQMYREHLHRMREIRHEREAIMEHTDGPSTERLYEMSDREAKDILMKKWDEEERIFQESREFQMQLMEVLGPKKIIQLDLVEKKYDKKMQEKKSLEYTGAADDGEM